jgi:hypothetical protein
MLSFILDSFLWIVCYFSYFLFRSIACLVLFLFHTNHLLVELDYDLFNLDLFSFPTSTQVHLGSTSRLLNLGMVRTLVSTIKFHNT